MRVTAALGGEAKPVAIRGAHKVDARDEQSGYWVVSDARGVIVATGVAAADGTGEEAFEHACRTVGITRQVLSLTTNPMDVICRNIRTVREKMATRPDILGCHLGGPFLAPARAFGFDKASPVTGTPLGLIAPGYAADLNLLDPTDWTAQHVWRAGRQVE